MANLVKDSERGSVVAPGDDAGGCVVVIVGLAVILLLAIYALPVIEDAVTDLGYVFASQHANQKHGAVAEAIDDVCHQGGEVTMMNPNTKRQAIICKIQLDGQEVLGVSIYEHGENVTSFLKEKMRSVDEVIRYLANQGYVK